MGLLTAPLTLAREPLRLTLRIWEFGLATAAEAARIGGDLLDRDRENGQPPYPEVVDEPLVGDLVEEPPISDVVDEPPLSAAPDFAASPPATETADAPPPVPDELVPDHVDEEPVLVAEAAEEGAAEGAGAELHVEPPWDGYDDMTAADIRDRLAVATPAEVATVELYESSGRNRRSVMDAAERALRG